MITASRRSSTIPQGPMPLEDPKSSITPPRVPKLAIRTRAEGAPTPSLHGQASSTSKGQDEDRIDPIGDHAGPAPKETNGVTSPQRKPASRPPTRTAPSPASPAPSTREKRRPNPLVSFLTLKEPSQSAFEQYAQQQRKQAAAKGGRAAGSLSGVSSQKLPATVPKVNSKWDGLPKPAKDKEAVKRRNRLSTISTISKPRKIPSNGSLHAATSPTSLRGVHGVPPSLAGSVHRGKEKERPQSLPFGQTQSVDGASASPAPPSPAAFARPHSLQPELAAGSRRPSDFGLPGAPQSSNKLLDRPGTPLNSPLDFSPVTPPDISPVPPDIILATLATPPQKLGRGREMQDLPPWPLAISPDSVIIKSSGPDVLGPPLTLKRKPKTINQAFLAGEAQELHLSDTESESPKSILKSPVPPIPATSAQLAPSPPESKIGQAVPMQAPPPTPSPNPSKRLSAELGMTPKFSYPERPASALARSESAPSPIKISSTQRAHSTSSENLPPTVRATRRRYSVETIHSVAESTAPSIAPSVALSVAPSVAVSVAPSNLSALSAQWYKSPKERLGLGGNIRHSTAAPWETRDYEGDVGEIAREQERNGAVTPSPGEGRGKKKRFIMRRR